MNKVIHLIAIDGILYFPHGGCPDVPTMLIKFYEAGDCDTIPWPLVPHPYTSATVESLERRLASALYDERETNVLFPIDAKISLPDGALFDFDAILAAACI